MAKSSHTITVLESSISPMGIYFAERIISGLVNKSPMQSMDHTEMLSNAGYTNDLKLNCCFVVKRGTPIRAAQERLPDILKKKKSI